jgi:hypothetical protein
LQVSAISTSRVRCKLGHDYEGLLFLDSRNNYPWEDQFVERDEESIARQHARENPYDVPKIHQLLKEPPQGPPSREELSSLGPISEREVCFIRLPWEIRKEMAVRLPTADALRLRRASRAFINIFSSQSFWASRFKADADRNFLFETRNSTEPRDWRSLYRYTNDDHIPPGLQNRKKIWNLIQSLKDILRLRWNSSCWSPSRASLRWREVAGDLRQEEVTGHYHRFDEGCRLFNKQCTSIPDLLSRIAFSIIRVGDVEYIAGIRLISNEGVDICLGYRAEGKELSQMLRS